MDLSWKRNDDTASESSGCREYSEENFDFTFNIVEISGKTTQILLAVDGSMPKNWNLLDIKSTEHNISNKQIMKNIWPSKKRDVRFMVAHG